MSANIQDLSFGEQQEVLMLPRIRAVFPDTVKIQKRFDHFDFMCPDPKVHFELKSRNNTKTKYNTINFSVLKLEEGRRRLKEGICDRIIYLFNFESRLDKTKRTLHFWEDNGSYDMPVVMRGNTARGEPDKPLCDLPIRLLKRF